MNWQVQEAKQRFSEVLRAVEHEGPQVITKHGKEVAIVIDPSEFHRITGAPGSFGAFLRGFPKLDVAPGESDVFDEIEAERRHQYAPVRDFEIELGLSDDSAGDREDR